MGRDSGIVLKAFREDPEKHPLKTPSGRIEIYSERLAKIAETWELPKTKGQEIHPIPRFIATAEMLGQGDPLDLPQCTVAPCAASRRADDQSDRRRTARHQDGRQGPRLQRPRLAGHSGLRHRPRDPASRGDASGRLVQA